MLPPARPVSASASLQPLDRGRGCPPGNYDGVGRWSGGQGVLALLFRERLHPDIDLFARMILLVVQISHAATQRCNPATNAKRCVDWDLRSGGMPAFQKC